MGDDTPQTYDTATDADADADAGQNAPEPLTAKDIEAWVLDPDNAERARALGMRLIANPSAQQLAKLDSLGPFEDRATTWAVNRPAEAKMLILKLIARLA